LLDFYKNKNNHLKNKILYLETVNEVSKDNELTKNNIKRESIDKNLTEDNLKKINEYNIQIINDKFKNLLTTREKFQNENMHINQENMRDNIINEIEALIKKCDCNLKELESCKSKSITKQNINESLFYDKNSYCIPNMNGNNFNLQNPNDNSFMNTFVINKNYSIIDHDYNCNMSQNDFVIIIKEKFIEYQNNLNFVRNNLMKEKELENKKNAKEIKLRSLKQNISEQKRKLEELINK